MKNTQVRLLFTTSLLLAGACGTVSVSAQQDGATAAEALLRTRDAEFSKDVIAVSPNVYTAVGYSPGNASMIVGIDGVVIVDTGQDLVQAEAIVAAFRAITSLPVRGIIYTHGHIDHTGGAAAFIGDEAPEIWALDNFGSEDRPLAAAKLTIQQERGARQAGITLPDALRINNGIAPAMRPTRAASASSVSTAPNRSFAEGRIAIEIAGLKLELVAAPGETSDQLYVWYPQQRVLFAGDNYYKSFPNLYAIRGTPYRDVLGWLTSLDLMLAEKAAAVVPGHTRPVLGESEVATALGNHRDAIRFVHDKTVEGMNAGMTPDQLVEYVKLPAELATNPDLGEYYGRVEWAVRSIFTGYLGWYGGNPTQLSPLSAREEAMRIAALAGGPAVLAERARTALAAGEAQWAAQLADYLLALNAADSSASLLKADALTMLARDSVNALGRNYYLTVANQLRAQATRQ